MRDSQFQIVLPGYSTSADEWKRALAAPSSDLPPLNNEQKEVARKFKITEEEYARNVLAGSYGQQRMLQRAQDLGEAVQKVLEGLGTGYRVNAVVREIDLNGWIVKVETPRRDVNVFVSQELADDLLDSGSDKEQARLRVRVTSSLEQGELTAKH